jgi:hypothetical protein
LDKISVQNIPGGTKTDLTLLLLLLLLLASAAAEAPASNFMNDLHATQKFCASIFLRAAHPTSSSVLLLLPPPPPHGFSLHARAHVRRRGLQAIASKPETLAHC